jgi:hypothetical protein
MTALRVLSLLPFVPSGVRWDASRSLFRELGFEEEWTNEDYVGFRNGEARFILQKFEDAAFASNFMIRLNVPDLESWCDAISEKRLDEKYPGFRVNTITEYPWGREVNFIDLAGVCWHVGEAE